jgi:hypothetical protein
VSLDGGATQVPLVQLSTLGNTHLRPERTGELEGGFDLGFGNDRLQLTVTLHNDITHDAIIQIPVPPSVSGNGTAGTTISKNIGVVRNTGTELTLNTRLLDSRAVSWTANAAFSKNTNKVQRLNPGESTIIIGNSRIQAGYPLGGQWAPPIVLYADANQNGIIDYDEIRLGDSAVFIGTTTPNYKIDAASTLSFLNGRMSVTTDVEYENGLTQTQGTLSRNTLLLNLPNTPGTTLATQAAVVAGTFNSAGNYAGSGLSDIGLMQTVNTFRINNLTINYQPPSSVARWFHVPTMSVALMGRNVWLHTNYRGKDPNVNAFSTSIGGGDLLQDTGQIPQPREWILNIRIGN